MSASAVPTRDGTLVLQAPAKINLYLEVLGRRADGFHELVTVLQTLELADTLALRLCPRDERLPPDTSDVRLEVLFEPPARGPVPSGPGNLVVRAADLVLQAADARADVALHMTLTKRVPAGGGLGGGSSDAAAALMGCNALLGSPLRHADLARLAATLGSDVPFFLHGGTCLCTGRGEHVEPIAAPRPFALTLVLPDFGVATPAVYAALDAPPLARAIPAPVDLSRAFDGGTVDVLERLFRNDLTSAAARVEPRLLAALRHPGVHLSGSGSTMFRLGVADDDDPRSIDIPSMGFVTTRSRKS